MQLPLPLDDGVCGDCDHWTNLAMDIIYKKGVEKERRIHYMGCSSLEDGTRVDHGHCDQVDACRLANVDACEHFKFLPNKDKVRHDRIVAKWEGKGQDKYGRMVCLQPNGGRPSKA